MAIRLILVIFVALGLAPGTFVRTPPLPDGFALRPASVTRLALPESPAGALTLTDIWQMRSVNERFGGFSALVALSGERLLAGSDRGFAMMIELDDGGSPKAGALQPFARGRKRVNRNADLEAMAFDAESGFLWSAFEGANAIQRNRIEDKGGVLTVQGRKRVRPPAMSGWSSNSGPEAMVRLGDGRFIVLSEAPQQDDDPRRSGLLFAGDPLTHDTPIPFKLATPRGFSPVDATSLPGGDVLILLRRWRFGLPIRFEAAIMRADPATITKGGQWTGPIIARLEGPLLGENFEGIAFIDEPERGPAVYVIADDNFSAFQRSLMLRFSWDEGALPLDARKP